MHPFQQGFSSHPYSVSNSGKNDNNTMPTSQNHQVRNRHHQYTCSNHSTKQVMESPHPPLKKTKLCNVQGKVPHHIDSVGTPIRQFPIPPPPPPLPSPGTRASTSSSASKAIIAEAPTTTPAKKHGTKQSVVPSSASISNDATYSSFSAPASTPVVHTSNGSTGKTASSAKSSRPATPKPKSEGSGVMGKGLRHFSMKVCEKVEERGTTSYNEVADEVCICLFVFYISFSRSCISSNFMLLHKILFRSPSSLKNCRKQNKKPPKRTLNPKILTSNPTVQKQSLRNQRNMTKRISVVEFMTH